jgi:hypothetical protein
LSGAIGLVKDYLIEKGGDFNAIVTSSGFQRIATIESLKNLINENDETRKRFEVMAREVFNKFKACLTIIKSMTKLLASRDAGAGPTAGEASPTTGQHPPSAAMGAADPSTAASSAAAESGRPQYPPRRQ